VFEVNIAIMTSRFARLQQPSTSVAIADHFTKLKISQYCLALHVPFVRRFPGAAACRKLIRDIHITDRLAFESSCCHTIAVRNAAEQIVTRIDRFARIDQLGTTAHRLPWKTFVERHNRIASGLSEIMISVLISGAFLQITALAFDNPTAF